MLPTCQTAKCTETLGIRLYLDISVIFEKLNIWDNISTMSFKYVSTIL